MVPYVARWLISIFEIFSPFKTTTTCFATFCCIFATLFPSLVCHMSHCDRYQARMQLVPNSFRTPLQLCNAQCAWWKQWKGVWSSDSEPAQERKYKKVCFKMCSEQYGRTDIYDTEPGIWFRYTVSEGEAPRKRVCTFVATYCISGIVIGPGAPTMKYQVHCTWSGTPTMRYARVWRQQKQHVCAAQRATWESLLPTRGKEQQVLYCTAGALKTFPPYHQTISTMRRTSKCCIVHISTIVKRSSSDPWDGPLQCIEYIVYPP